MKKIFLSIIMLFTIVTTAQAEQWIYIKKIDMTANSAATLLDLDSLNYDKDSDTITFSTKKNDGSRIYMHKMIYVYKTKQFAILETTKYHSWMAPENKEFTHTFDNPEYHVAKEDAFSEFFEMLISDKNNIEHLKTYSHNITLFLQEKLTNTLKNIDEANILFWIDGKGKVYSYEYLFGNYDNAPTTNIITYEGENLYYSIALKRFTKSETRCVPTFNITKITQPGYYTSYGSVMTNYVDSNYGKISNKNFFDKFIATITSKKLTPQQKSIAYRQIILKNANYNQDLSTELSGIEKFEIFSENYTKGVIGIILKLK